MHQYDHETAVPVQPTPSAPGTPGFMRDGDAGLGVAPSIWTSELANSIMMEIINAVEGGGLTLDKENDGQLYAAMVAIATAVAGGAAGTTGDIKMRAEGTVPAGWLECNGAAVSRATYAALFAVIGVTYGAGNGTTTFNLPNFDDRFPVGANGTTRAIAASTAASLGELTITMEQATSPGSGNDTNPNPGVMTDSGGRSPIAAPIYIAEAGAPGSDLEPASVAVMFVIKT